jgi:large subunit ribosomal protein L23
MAELHDILLKPVITEKTARLNASKNTYVFHVGDQANKIQIKDAIEKVFGVRVTGVRTSRMPGKPKRFGKHWGRTPAWKKAFVTVAEGDTLNFYEG